MQIDLQKHLNFRLKSNFVIDNIIKNREIETKEEESKNNSETRTSESTKNGSSGITSSDEEQQ
jgi:hypothetical protein